ncbi:SAM-dependent methyltransferase [Nonomuraea sp. NPDC049419]|uniref:class I SAM-dependent methyltransferase n=1 Tax=Nonomuraea sp. NPDC049419 TaxID=3155772 RepID=UPI00342FB8D2
MRDAQPSQTALMAAAARAAHLVVDGEPFLFRDTLAGPLLGALADELIGYHRRFGEHIVLAGTRAQVTSRGGYTERRAAELAEAGVRRHVVLGAGLDTYAWRARPGVHVIEVDHPDTQRWKRDLMGAAGLDQPPCLTFVPLDLETGDLPAALHATLPATEPAGGADGGADGGERAFVSWLGVTMYLTEEAIEATLAALGRLPAGSEVVIEYALPPELRDERGAAFAEFAMGAAADRGEPWLSFFSPGDLAALLKRHGLEAAEHVRQADCVDPALWRRADALRPADACRLVRATVAP